MSGPEIDGPRARHPCFNDVEAIGGASSCSLRSAASASQPLHTRRRTPQQQLFLPHIPRETRRPLELGSRLLEPLELHQKIPSHAREKMISLQRWFLRQRIRELEARRRAECHPNRNRPIQLDNRRLHHARVTRRDLGLKRIRTKHATDLPRTLERGEPAANEQLVPPSTILIEQQNRF